MAISGVNKRRQDALNQEASRDTETIGKPHAQPPAFRATGKGLANRLPDVAATAYNANGSIKNLAAPSRQGDLYRMYLFVNAIETGFALAGEYGQAQFGRVFYPRNLSQDELVIEGIVANNYEYDRLVRFVEHHHNTQFSSRLKVAQSLDGNSVYPGIDFLLAKPTVGNTFNSFRPIKLGVLITDMAAGAERFKYAREYSLQCKVIHDYLQTDIVSTDSIRRLITRQQVYGTAVDPATRTAYYGDGS